MQALVVILGKKTHIEADEAMVRTTYNIIEAHVYYDFPTFISNEIKRCLYKIEKFDFRHSSYLWWLMVHQNLKALMEAGLQIEPISQNTSLAPINLRVPIMTKLYGLYYEFMDKFYAIMVQIMIRKLPSRLCRSTI